MKVLFLTSEYPPYTWGGLGRYSYEVYQELKRFCEVDVLNVPSYSILLANLSRQSHGTEVIHDGASKVIHVFCEEMIQLLSKDRRAEFHRYTNVAQRLVEESTKALRGKYDLVFVQDYYNSQMAAYLLLNNFVRKVVSVCHLPLYAGFTYFDKPVCDELHQVMESILLRISSRVVVPSEFAKRVLLQIYSIDTEDIVVNPLGVRLPGAGHPKAGGVGHFNTKERGNGVRILSIARLVEQKGVHYVVDVLKRLDTDRIDFVYTIIGQGPREKDFYSLADAFGVLSHVRHIRHIDFRKEVFRFYETADVYLSTSLYETFGLTVLEAMAHGCVPVAFRVGALEELMEHGATGLFADVNDSQKLTEHIVDLSQNPSKLSAMGEKAADYARRFSWQRHVNVLIQVFEECLA